MPMDEEWPLIRCLSDSYKGIAFTITYSLRCFVKHDSWNEFGEGQGVEMPVRIVQPFFAVLPDRTRDLNDKIILEESKIEEGGDETKVPVLEDAASVVYYHKCVQDFEKTWFKPDAPVTSTVEQEK
jgi:hypothetical protein